MDTRRGTKEQMDTKMDTVEQPAKWDSMTRKQLMATATEYRAERDAAKSDTLRAFDERNALLDARRFDCDWLGHRNDILEEAAKVCDQLFSGCEPLYGARTYNDDCAAAIRALKT